MSPAITPPPVAGPAVKVAADLQWLAKTPGMTGQYVAEVTAAGPNEVHVVVQDPDSGLGGGSDATEANHYIADNAASILRPQVQGVKLLAVAADGYAGKPGYFDGDEQYFASNIPGVTSQAAEVGWDVNKDGKVGDDESAFLFPVSSKAAGDRIAAIVTPTINDLPVAFDVEG